MTAPDDMLKLADPKHPVCQKCNWRMGGVDSWNGSACKCGYYAPPIKCVEAVVIPMKGPSQ